MTKVRLLVDGREVDAKFENGVIILPPAERIRYSGREVAITYTYKPPRREQRKKAQWKTERSRFPK